MTSTSRTARCGTACRVVWQGRGQFDRPLCRCASDMTRQILGCHVRSSGLAVSGQPPFQPCLMHAGMIGIPGR